MQARLNSTVVLAILLLNTFYITAQQPLTFRKYQEEDGLSNGFVTSMFQDSPGFLWLGTANGVNWKLDFARPNYFSTVFSDFYGVSPTEMREQISQNSKFKRRSPHV
ncbi:MAG: hypothetical protein KTR30_17440 [Saprospiraceae bacterium]|nr:hypothetical protein [Saprospiraceae bacterium]